MAYNEALAQRIRGALAGKDGVSERRMFGGIAFMVNDSMCCGVVKDDLMARVGPDGHDAALARPGARVMDFAHRPMRGMVYVAPLGYEGDALDAWVQQCYDFAGSLPPKAPPRPRKTRSARQGARK